MKSDHDPRQGTEPPLSRLLWRPEEGASALGISRTRIYELMRDGSLRSVRLGGSRRIRADDLKEFVAQLGD